MSVMLARLVLPFVLCVLAMAPAGAFTIQEVRSPGGIEAWLVEDHTVPLLAISFSFRSGSASDPKGKEGLSNFLTGMIDEGAGDLDSAAFQRRRDELGFRLSFDSGLDNFEGSFQTLTRNREASLDLLRKAITSPHFSEEPLERMRKSFLLSISEKRDDPQTIAIRRWMETALAGDPYAIDSKGSPVSVSSITAADLREAHGRIFNRRILQVSVVGDIDAKSLGAALDHIFGGLPDTEPGELPPAGIPVVADRVQVTERGIPQSIIVFGHEGIRRNDPDFIPAYVMTEILGGGGFDSWLTTEIREKRGLTYGIGAGLSPLRRMGLFLGSLSTRNEKAGEALALVRDTMRRMAEQGPSQRELDEAKTYLTGSYALRFTSNQAIASELLGLQEQGFGPDYVVNRNAMIEAVTLDQVKAQAKRLLHPDRLLVSIVGKPEGLN